MTLDHGLPAALRKARAAGAATIAAHRIRASRTRFRAGQRAVFAREADHLRPLIDRYELINRTDVFSWVVAESLPGVASGDFHTRAHLETWKTVLPCETSADAVIAHLRSHHPSFVTRFASVTTEVAA